MWWIREGEGEYPLGFKPCWRERDYHLDSVAILDSKIGYECNLFFLQSHNSNFPAIFLLSHPSYMLMASNEAFGL